MEDYQSALEEAIRKRILEEISSAREAQIINNIYGGGGSSEPAPRGNLQEQMFDPKDYNYWVDIQRADVFDPEGQKIGWKKKVKRYADPREKMIDELFGGNQE